jgi:hypothetical protein
MRTRVNRRSGGVGLQQHAQGLAEALKAVQGGGAGDWGVDLAGPLLKKIQQDL